MADAFSVGFWRGRRVVVTGATGFVGRNLVPLLEETGADVLSPTHADYDLTEQRDVRRLFADTKPELVVHLAGLIGGILANRDRPAEFCYENLAMGTLVMHEAWRAGAAKFVTLIGGCSYPSHARSPIVETDLWNGYPQPESAPYSLAKRMSAVQAAAYRRQYGFDAVVLVPGNLYGPHDNFDLSASHVIPALIRRFTTARREGQPEVVAWGSGRPTRDFVYVGDACRIIRRAIEQYSSSEIVNISSGVEVSIRELVEMVAELTGYTGQIVWDASKPDGQLNKGFAVDRMRDALGATCTTSLRDGLLQTIRWFEANEAHARLVA